jgi:hypothetical protein
VALRCNHFPRIDHPGRDHAAGRSLNCEIRQHTFGFRKRRVGLITLPLERIHVRLLRVNALPAQFRLSQFLGRLGQRGS